MRHVCYSYVLVCVLHLLRVVFCSDILSSYSIFCRLMNKDVQNINARMIAKLTLYTGSTATNIVNCEAPRCMH